VQFLHIAPSTKRIKIESMGIEYDEEALASGEYDELLMGE